MGREFIDGLGEHLRQDRSDLFPSKPGALRERIDHIWSKRISNITGSGRLVGPVPIQDLAMSPNPVSCNCLRRPSRPPTTLPGEISSAPPGQVGTLSASGALRLPLIYLEASSGSSAIISGFVRWPPGTAEPEPPPKMLSSKPIETSHLALHAALHLLRPKYRINSPHNLLVDFGRIS